jgi:cell division protein ZapA
MVANDNAGYLIPRGVLRFIASRLAPTVQTHQTVKTMEDTDLQALMARLELLITRVEQLKSQNGLLLAQEKTWREERAHLIDKEYSIICPQEERSNLVSAARYLDGKMREIRSSGKVIGADRIAVMAALNITHDLLHKEERPDIQASGSTREQVRDLLDRVDLVLATDPDVTKG